MNISKKKDILNIILSFPHISTKLIKWINGGKTIHIVVNIENWGKTGNVKMKYTIINSNISA